MSKQKTQIQLIVLQTMLRLFILVLSAGTIISCNSNENTGSNKDSVAKSENGIPSSITQLQEQANKYTDSTELQLQLAEKYDSLRMHNEAIKAINNVIKKDSLNNQLWLMKGLYQQNAGDTSGAIVSYNRSLKVYQTKDALLNLANIYAYKKDKRALQIAEILSDEVHDASESAEVDYLRGLYYANTNNVNDAVYYFNNTIAADFKFMLAYIEKALLLQRNKKYTEAEKVFDQAIQVDARYADSYYFKAKLYEAMNKKAEAIELYKTSLEFDPLLTEAEAALKRLENK